MKVVFDTNVLVAALRSKLGASFALLRMIPSDKFALTVSLPLYIKDFDNIELFGIEAITPNNFLERIK